MTIGRFGRRPTTVQIVCSAGKRRYEVQGLGSGTGDDSGNYILQANNDHV